MLGKGSHQEVWTSHKRRIQRGIHRGAMVVFRRCHAELASRLEHGPVWDYCDNQCGGPASDARVNTAMQDRTFDQAIGLAVSCLCCLALLSSCRATDCYTDHMLHFWSLRQAQPHTSGPCTEWQSSGPRCQAIHQTRPAAPRLAVVQGIPRASSMVTLHSILKLGCNNKSGPRSDCALLRPRPTITRRFKGYSDFRETDICKNTDNTQ
jgi:hypothetical protein